MIDKKAQMPITEIIAIVIAIIILVTIIVLLYFFQTGGFTLGSEIWSAVDYVYFSAGTRQARRISAYIIAGCSQSRIVKGIIKPRRSTAYAKRVTARSGGISEIGLINLAVCRLVLRVCSDSTRTMQYNVRYAEICHDYYDY